MRGAPKRFRAELRGALNRFFQLGNSNNEYFLIGFGEKPRLLVDWTGDTGALASKLDDLPLMGMTALHDACRMGVEKLRQGSHRKRAIILISDGEDSVSRRWLHDVRRLFLEEGVLLYWVAMVEVPGTHDRRFYGPAYSEQISRLEELASVTGGQVYAPLDPEGLHRLLEDVAVELRNQYRITFEAASAAKSGRWRAVKIKASLPANAPQKMGQPVRTAAPPRFGAAYSRGYNPSAWTLTTSKSAAATSTASGSSRSPTCPPGGSWASSAANSSQSARRAGGRAADAAS